MQLLYKLALIIFFLWRKSNGFLENPYFGSLNTITHIMKRFLITTLFLCITASCFSQKLDSYKYVVIPYEFGFLKKHDQYRVNSLVRFLFKKEGFEVLYNSETFPQDLADDRCLALYVDIDDDSGMFITKTKLLLKDCANRIIFESEEGKSRIKAYEKAYNESLRDAFRSVKAQNYSYTPGKKEKVIVETKPVVETPKATTDTKKGEYIAVKPKVEVVKEEKKPVIKEVVKETATIKEVKTATTKAATKAKSSVLYAQPLENGYQLVDNTPKVVMVLLKTNIQDVYLVKGKDALVYKKDGKWLLSNVTDSGNEVRPLNVKF